MRQRLIDLGSGCLLAFQLLTTIPIRLVLQWNDQRARASVAFYPLTGLVLGLLLYVQAYVLITNTTVSSIIIVAWLITFSIFYSGGLHLDGYADFSDAIFSRQSTQRKLEIMKDSRVGAFGVLSLLLLLSWRFLFMYEWIIETEALYFLLIIPFISRFLMGSQLVFGSFAREDGMAVMLKPAQTLSLKAIYSSWLAVLTILMLAVSGGVGVLVLLFSILFLISWLVFCRKQIHGITGDTIGAGTEGSETFLWAVVFLLYSFGMA